MKRLRRGQQKCFQALCFTVLGALTAACAPRLDLQTGRVDPTKLVNLEGRPLLDPQQGNCSIHEFNAPGQGFHASGSTGGIRLGGVVGWEAVTVKPEDYGQTLFQTHFVGSPLPRPVALLLVDDFSGVNSPGVVFAGSHGLLVRDHTLAVIAGSRHYGVPVRDGASPGNETFTFTSGSERFLVRTVDTHNFDTGLIAEATARAIDDVFQRGVEQVVVNMSFGIVPCSVLRDYQREQERQGSGNTLTYDEYARELANVNHLFYDSFQRYVFGPLEPQNDPLLKTVVAELRCESSLRGNLAAGRPARRPFETLRCNEQKVVSFPATSHVLFVGAAGNYGLGFPLYPAAWSEVVGASSADITGGNSWWSNKGDVRDVGEVFLMNNYSYLGTSFASPNLAVFEAWALAQGGGACLTGSGAGTAARTVFETANDAPMNAALSGGCP